MKATNESIIDVIIEEMKQFMSSYYYSYDMWYVGISEEPKIHLSSKHKVNVDYDPWIQISAPNSDVARIVERHFVEGLGSDGDRKRVNVMGTNIYAYKKNMHTNP